MSAETGDQQQVSKGLLITLGVVAAIGVAAALWVFVLQPLSADDADTVAVDDDADATEPGPELDAEPTPEPDGEPDDPGEDADPEDGEDADEAEDDALETTQVVNARDPFTQLATDTGGDGDTGGSATGGTATGGDSASGGDSTSGGGTTTGDGGGDGDSGDGDDQADVDSTTVTLVTIYTGDDGLQRAAVEVDEAGYDVLEGDTFAGNFQLLDIADECATMLYGDSRFTLCEGDRVRK